MFNMVIAAALPWVSAFCDAVKSLPDGLPVPDEHGSSAEFAYGPVIDMDLDADSQLLDFLNLWLPLDGPENELHPLLTRGEYGLDRVSEWLTVFVHQYSIGAATREPIARRIENLVGILTRMYVAVENVCCR